MTKALKWLATVTLLGLLAGSVQYSVARAQSAEATHSKLARVDDLKDKRIAVLLGSAQVPYATRTYPNATLLQYDSPSDLVLAVKTGKADAGVSDSEPLREIMRQDDSIGVLGDTLFSFPVGVGFSKQNPALLAQFNQFLTRLKQDGTHADMLKRWLETNDTNMPTLATPNASRELVVGVSDGALPYVAIKDNTLIGLDVELSQRFAAAIGRTIRFSQMQFGALIAAVSAGKVDMIISDIFITDERKLSINFSDPYYDEGTKAFALKKHIVAYDAALATAAATPAPTTWLTRAATSFRRNIIQERRYLLLWDGLKTTMLISIFAALFGTLVGAIVCYMRMSKRRLLSVPARLFISVLRGTPVLVLLMLVFYVVFASVSVNPLIVAILAFGLNFGAYAAEIFRTGVEGVARGQAEAAVSMGFSRLGAFVHIVLPQTVQRILPVYRGEFISLVKMTSIVGYVAVQDLTKASDIIRSRTFDAFFPLILVAVLYFLIAWVLMLALEFVERTTDPHRRRRRAARA